MELRVKTLVLAILIASSNTKTLAVCKKLPNYSNLQICVDAPANTPINRQLLSEISLAAKSLIQQTNKLSVKKIKNSKAILTTEIPEDTNKPLPSFEDSDSRIFIDLPDNEINYDDGEELDSDDIKIDL